mmetsp:Transcript_129810/g.277067  ORF Transcript_129810/g.277067 Transcript_129810/m.277067 type:complete len:210 (+) Transcript_129810:485-1114(+)
MVDMTLAEVHALRNQGQCRHDSGVATCLGALGADDVHALGQCLRHMVRRTHHVHHRDSCSMELVHRPLWWHAHSSYEEPHLLLDQDVNKLWQISASVVLVGLPRIAADLWQEEVHPKVHAGLQQRPAKLDLFSQGGRRHTDATERANAAGIGDGRDQLVGRDGPHARQHDGMLNLQELRERRLDAHRRHLSQQADVSSVGGKPRGTETA